MTPMKKSLELVSARYGWSICAFSRFFITAFEQVMNDRDVKMNTVKIKPVVTDLMPDMRDASASDLCLKTHLPVIPSEHHNTYSVHLGILIDSLEYTPFGYRRFQEQNCYEELSPLIARARVIRSTKMRRKKMMNKHKHRKRLKKNRNKTKR